MEIQLSFRTVIATEKKLYLFCFWFVLDLMSIKGKGCLIQPLNKSSYFRIQSEYCVRFKAGILTFGNSGS